MTVEAIKLEIGHLSEKERRQLLEWLEGLENEAWDLEMERDFSPGGRGEHLVAEMDREIARAISAGAVTSLEEGLRIRRERRRRK